MQGFRRCPHLDDRPHGADERWTVLVYYWTRGTRLCVGFDDRDMAEQFITWRRNGWPDFMLECMHDNTTGA